MKRSGLTRIPADVLEHMDAVFAALVENRKGLEAGRSYGLRFGLSPALRAVMAERYGRLGKLLAAQFFDLGGK